jgi:hypothetical protein
MVNILLIENQKKQFDHIYNCFQKDDLSSQYRIFPANTDFVKFIDYVRVWVNENYSKYDSNNINHANATYREVAMNNIIKTIHDNDIKILLMDYKLGAAYLSKTGIDLATEVNTLLNNQLPVVFISKDQKNEKIEKELEAYECEKIWIYKGFFGDEILQTEYIKKYVIKNGIEKLLSDNKEEKKLNDIQTTIE